MENTLKQNIQPLQKDYSISLIRLISIIFIILCHFFQYFDHFLAWHFNIGVQLFLIISGFLWGYERYKNFDIARWWKSTKKIMFDYILVCIITFLLNKIFSTNNLEFFDLLKMIFGFFIIKGATHLWFVPLILFCYLITPMLSFFKEKIEKHYTSVKWLLKFALMFISSFVVALVFKSFNYVWVLCYLYGFLFAEQIKNIRKTFFINIFPTLLFAIGLRLFVELVDHSSNIYFFINYYSLNQISSLARFFTTISLFLILYYAFSFIPFKDKLKTLDFSDKYIYTLYLTHQILIFEPLTTMHLTPILPINIVLTLIFIALYTAFIIILAKLLKLGFNKIKKSQKIIKNT